MRSMYRLRLSTVSTDDPLKDKHPQLVRCFKKLRGAWACDVSKFEISHHHNDITCRLRKGLPKGVFGEARYVSELEGSRDSQFHDSISLRFDPHKHDLQSLIDQVIPALVEATDPFEVELESEEISLDDFDLYLEGFGRFGILHHLDAVLCREAFGLTPAAVQKLLKPHVDSVTAGKAGVQIIVTRELLEKDVLKALGAAVRSKLPNSPFPAADPALVLKRRSARSAPPAAKPVRKRSGPKATYALVLRARDAGLKHWNKRYQQLIECLSRQASAWNTDPTRIEPPVVNKDAARCLLTPLLPQGMKGEVKYNLRQTRQVLGGMISGPDSSHNDDTLTVSFDAREQDFDPLIDSIIPALIEAFEPYYAWLNDGNVGVLGLTSRGYKQMHSNGRCQVSRLDMVTYLDAGLCREGLGLSPAEVKRRVEPGVAEVSSTRQGVYIVMTRKILKPATLHRRGGEIRKLLPEGPPRPSRLAPRPWTPPVQQ